MKKRANPAAKEAESPAAHPGFARVVDAFAKARDVTRETRKGFGSGALKVNGKIFAMMASQGEFVVKLPRARVDELIEAGDGERWEPGPGRVMKEWLAVDAEGPDWLGLAKEAYAFVKAG